MKPARMARIARTPIISTSVKPDGDVRRTAVWEGPHVLEKRGRGGNLFAHACSISCCMIFNPAVRLPGGIPRLRMPWLTNVFHQADPAGCLAISFLGVLNNTASGVLAPWPCSRTPPYAPPVQQWLPPSGCTRQFASFPSSSLRAGLDSPLRPDSAHAF